MQHLKTSQEDNAKHIRVPTETFTRKHVNVLLQPSQNFRKNPWQDLNISCHIRSQSTLIEFKNPKCCWWWQRLWMILALKLSVGSHFDPFYYCEPWPWAKWALKCFGCFFWFIFDLLHELSMGCWSSFDKYTALAKVFTVPCYVYLWIIVLTAFSRSFKILEMCQHGSMLTHFVSHQFLNLFILEHRTSLFLKTLLSCAL